jgi:glycosyltransferase involved in cell wall biosynthesis
MNIAFFTNNYLPNVYGVPRSLETFRRELEAAGHTVFIFAPNFSGHKDNDPKIFRYPSVDTEFKFKFPLAIPYSRKLDKILAGLKLDIIHSHHPNLLGTAAAKWAKKKNIPLVFTWHTLYDQYANFFPFLPQKFVAKWIIGKAVKYANRADKVIVPTESVVPILKKWGVEKEITPVATGVVESEFKNPERQKVREEYGIAEDETLLLLVSRLTEEKNIQFVFEAGLKILKKNQKTKFMIVGDGYLALELKNRTCVENLSDRIIFSGIVEHGELKNYYAAGDIFVAASKSETQGMNVSEAMFAGLPIVALEASGVKSLVENGRNGILVSENEDEFIAAVEKLVLDKDLRKKMADESAKIIREKYTSKICAEKIVRVYEEAIKEKRKE